MKKIGDFWIPDVDLSIWNRFGRTRQKTIKRFSGGGPKTQDLLDVLAVVPRGRVAVDGGANVGVYARLLAQHFEKVYAFEPAVDTFEALQRNIEDWGLADRVMVRNEALSNVVETVSLSRRIWGRSVSRTISGPGELPAVSIDSLDLENLDLIKLDIEGYEYQALVGAEETLKRFGPWVMFEDKVGKREASDTSTDPHLYLQSQGAELAGRFGKGQFDYLYRFNRP